MNATEAEIKTAIEEAVRTQVEPLTKPALRTEVLTRTQLKLRTALRTKLKLRIPIKLRIPVLWPPEARGVKKVGVVYPEGTVVWKQGLYWKIIPPPYDVKKPLSSRTPPEGVTVTEGTPQETLTFIGGVVPAENISFDLGVTDGFIDVANRRIVFTGYGEETKVGLRMPEPTRGLTMRHVAPVRTYRKPTRDKRTSPPQVRGIRIFE
jgi:hypothetical protein